MKKVICAILVLFVSVSIFPQRIKLKFNGQGKFKIVQFTDIHYKTGTEGSAKSLKMMNEVLDAEKPDLIVYTGDAVTCKPQKQGWDDVLAPAISRSIPYAVVYGNHDDEYDWSRKQITDYITDKPFCLVQDGPGYIKGIGNYILEIKDESDITNALLYCFDSNAYDKIDEQKGYGWFDFSQIEWYRKSSLAYTKQNGGNPYPALAFFHIPLQEYTLLSDTTKKYVKNREVFGNHKERECPGIINTGMFAAMVECGDVMGTFVGHDHDNDYIGYLNGICLAYGRFSGSKNTYTNLGYGARIIELKKGERIFDTWIRTSDNEVLYSVSYPKSFTEEKNK